MRKCVNCESVPHFLKRQSSPAPTNACKAPPPLDFQTETSSVRHDFVSALSHRNVNAFTFLTSVCEKRFRPGFSAISPSGKFRLPSLTCKEKYIWKLLPMSSNLSHIIPHIATSLHWDEWAHCADLRGLWQWLKLLQGWSEFPCQGYRTIVIHLWNPAVGANFPSVEFLRVLGSQSGVSVWQHTLVS